VQSKGPMMKAEQKKSFETLYAFPSSSSGVEK